jgi:hypothetical protein
MIPVTRPVNVPSHEHPHVHMTEGAGRPVQGGALRITAPLPVTGPGGQPYAGMDPSNQLTWVRPWNPASGMIGRLNFDGAACQEHTDMGGTWSNPASWNAQVGGRPRRRPR